MLKLPTATYDWALLHLIREGDTDLFPSPFEIRALRAQWSVVEPQLANLDLTNYAWRGGRRFLVPKKMLAFRVATQLDPLDSLVIAAVIREFGPPLEARRLPVAEGRVFSYRLAPAPDGRLYAAAPTWHDFWKASLDRAERPGCTHVVLADVADFYNQVYHHVIERQLEAACLPEPAARVIKRFLQTLTGKVSRGLPVGPHVSHILAESALDPTDRSLLSHGYDFCRYVDDFHIFAPSEEAAVGALYDLARILDNQQKLMLQNDKTQVMPAADFAALARAMLIDRPANDREKEILKLIASKTGGDPYREVSLADLTPNELRVLSREVLEELLSHYLNADKVDYPRLSWVLRRLTQVGAPGAVEFLLSRIAALSPVLGPVARYVMAAVPNYSGDRQAIGELVVRALDLPVVRKSPYLQAVLLDVLATMPELDHADAVTARYYGADPLVRREILLVAGSGGRGDWLRDRRSEFQEMDAWTRRALVNAAVALPHEEARFWFDSVRGRMTAMEKLVALTALPTEQLKLGEIRVALD
jgi:hypothetical protein